MVAAVGSIRSSSGASSSGIDDLSASDNAELAGVDQELMKLINQINQMMNMLQHGNTQQNPTDNAASGVGAMGGHHHRHVPQSLLSDDDPDTSTPAPAAASFAAPATSPAPVVAATPSTTPADGVSGAGGASWGGLSTAPQTTALSESQGHAVAEQYIANLQKDFGLTHDQAAGIVANLWHESGGMNSGINQGGAIGQPSSNMADDNGNGYGIAQWGGSRKQGLIDFAHANGLDPSSQAANYGYLKQELQTDHANAIAAVKGTSSADAATEAFSSSFEQASDPEMASRLQDLQEV
ncbi:phage tail tip lysozyme [Paraburkholderia bryophila]|uniref:phage tail tip lysozyme n=1 Tax=Paraburkholderia bryophila TaxID=420952 RepID=UPI00234B9386|nr:phage tail tip lysozyme [Paraburkholderia bryophila]WCM24403.1 phage tail tip lysozyme [Paraburkholderia bryophila]